MTELESQICQKKTIKTHQKIAPLFTGCRIISPNNFNLQKKFFACNAPYRDIAITQPS